jgi:hypothetical protein
MKIKYMNIYSKILNHLQSFEYRFTKREIFIVLIFKLTNTKSIWFTIWLMDSKRNNITE